MSKTHVPARVDDELLDMVRQVADQQGWTFSTAVEIALRRLVMAFDGVPPLYLARGSEDDPPMQMRANIAVEVIPDE